MLEWNSELDAVLRTNTRSYSISSSARNMQLPVTVVRSRIKKLDLVPATHKEEKTPSSQEWIDACTKHAAARNVSVTPALAGSRHRRYVVVRVLAWNELLQNRRYSIAGVARISGYDHTSILHGRKRLNTLLAIEAATLAKHEAQKAQIAAERARRKAHLI